MKRQNPWRRIFGPHPEQEVDEELKFHIEQRTREYIAQGMSPEAARRTAAEKFGNVTQVRETCTSMLAADRSAEARRTFVGVSWLDVKLGLRMFAKFPGLSIVAVLGLTLAVTIGAGYFGFIGALLDSPLPFEGGERVVMIEKRYVAGPDTGDTDRASEHDFVQWRGTIKSIEELSAFRDESYNLLRDGVPPRPVRVAAITASSFRLTHGSPVIGRALLDEDERPGAPPVLVISYYDWQHHFNGDPAVLGSTVRLDETAYAIVGVMADGYAFPRSHGYWVPLRLTAAAANPAAEPSIFVFGRLAAGVSLKQAAAELATVGDQLTRAFPQTHANTRPEPMSYTHVLAGVKGPDVELAVRSIQIGVGLMLLIVAVNVSIVVYARTATRMGEIAVRTALGASRMRIVMQLFVEALILSLTSAVIGLSIVAVMMARVPDILNRSDDPGARLDYWINFGISPSLIAYVSLLAILSGLIVGVLPALKSTGKRVNAGLQHFGSRGSSIKLGRTWTALIILQVAITVAALPTAMYFGSESLRAGLRSAAPATHELVRGTLAITRDDATGDGGSAARARVGDPRFTDRMTTLIQRLESEPDVSAVTFADRVPGAEFGADIEVDGAGPGDQPIPLYVRFNSVALNLFDVFDVPMLAGRRFVTADTLKPTAGLIVDQAFAKRLSGGSVLGRRVRYAQRMASGEMSYSPWYEIVGVVPAFAETITPTSSISGTTWPRMYHAVTPSQVYPATLVVRVRGGDPMRIATKLREVTATVDPTLKLERVNGVLPAWNSERMAFRMMALAISAGTLSVLLLSAAGIYAMMSFTVSRRRREIGIRAALGADARRVVTGIFGRAGAQLGAGIVAGLAIASAFEWLGPGGVIGPNAPIILPAVVVLMLTVGLLAAIGPARRGLAVQPTEALREE